MVLGLVTFGFSRMAAAQQADNGIELTGFFGYQLSPTVDTTTPSGITARMDIGDSPVYGASLGRRVQPGVRTEFSWRFQPTHVTTLPVTGEGDSFDLAVHYFHAAVSYEKGNDRVKGFGLLGFGGTLTHPENGYNDAWFWSFAVALGLKVKINDRFGLRLESRMGVPFRFESGAIWCTSAGGCVAALSGGHAIAQIDFGGGPFFSF
jgi:hypothetical protein